MLFSIQSKNGNSFLLPASIMDQSDKTTAQSICKIQNLLPQTFDPNFLFSKQLQQYLQGKMLLLDELPFSINEIHQHYLHGYIQYHHGIVYLKNKQFQCQRCGNKFQHLFASFPCARCQEENCVYCRNCIMMGRVSQCTPLLTWTGPIETTFDSTTGILKWGGQLSKGQAAASNKVVKAIQSKTDLLVWAV